MLLLELAQLAGRVVQHLYRVHLAPAVLSAHVQSQLFLSLRSCLKPPGTAVRVLKRADSLSYDAELVVLHVVSTTGVAGEVAQHDVVADDVLEAEPPVPPVSFVVVDEDVDKEDDMKKCL